MVCGGVTAPAPQKPRATRGRQMECRPPRGGPSPLAASGGPMLEHQAHNQGQAWAGPSPPGAGLPVCSGLWVTPPRGGGQGWAESLTCSLWAWGPEGHPVHPVPALQAGSPGADFSLASAPGTI